MAVLHYFLTYHVRRRSGLRDAIRALFFLQKKIVWWCTVSRSDFDVFRTTLNLVHTDDRSGIIIQLWLVTYNLHDKYRYSIMISDLQFIDQESWWKNKWIREEISSLWEQNLTLPTDAHLNISPQLGYNQSETAAGAFFKLVKVSYAFIQL